MGTCKTPATTHPAITKKLKDMATKMPNKMRLTVFIMLIRIELCAKFGAVVSVEC